jgi:hypothetical protein
MGRTTGPIAPGGFRGESSGIPHLKSEMWGTPCSWRGERFGVKALFDAMGFEWDRSAHCESVLDRSSTLF